MEISKTSLLGSQQETDSQVLLNVRLLDWGTLGEKRCAPLAKAVVLSGNPGGSGGATMAPRLFSRNVDDDVGHVNFAEVRWDSVRPVIEFPC
ncbi:unnamed protein product [Notodromas monacha]|uniref:Uncharacterized protein n=1 Tax=Notodromas monacha TaxID=399045 RepID=A0A7R9GJ41_9CRUS|nr:unnamed protein product [Notodromas monacha]CAG0924494.1 unnamed protein product [Notodromas monacha]